MTTRQQAEDAFQKARTEAAENARAACEELSIKSPLTLSAFRLMSTQAVAGVASAQVPIEPVPRYLTKASLPHAVGELFSRDLVAWNTAKGWIYTQDPTNPQTKRKLRGEIHLTEKALMDYGDDLYRVYFLANDFDHGDHRPTRRTLPQWRATLAKQVAPNAKVAPPLMSTRARRIR